LVGLTDEDENSDDLKVAHDSDEDDNAGQSEKDSLVKLD